MGHRQRMDAMFRAQDRAREARDKGEPITANPYKPGPWSNHIAWEIAWQKRDAELGKGWKGMSCAPCDRWIILRGRTDITHGCEREIRADFHPLYECYYNERGYTVIATAWKEIE